MNNTDWLFGNADVPIRYNLLLLKHDPTKDEIVGKLLEHPQVQYWMQYPRKCWEEQSVGPIHGGDDYRFECYMGRLTQLGLRSGIEPFHTYASFYLDFLRRQIELPREKQISFSKIYSYYDQELLIAAYLALAGCSDDPAVRFVAEKRIRLLHEFTREKRYDIYVDGSKFPGVPNQWQPYLINPDLYHDGNIRLPTLYDFVLLGTVSHDTRVDTIVEWIFAEDYRKLHYGYGYFYAPGGSYSTKAVCRELALPDLSVGMPPGLLNAAFILSHFRAAVRSRWFQDALLCLESFRTEHDRYKFPSKVIPSMGENRRKRISIEIESTYWMERIRERTEV